MDEAKKIFLDALDLAPGSRTEFLAGACRGDDELRRKIERWLTAHDRADSLLANRQALQTRPAARPAREVQAGDRVGPYRLVEHLGEGGFGVVFLAEQEEPVRRVVALKIVKSDVASSGVLARFEHERRALALMDHPNIARALDAGTMDDGRPYFVMERVSGRSLVDHFVANALPLRARLELLLVVCRAVEHAHRKGLVHRDLKPTNVLVTEIDGKAVPKVIDFGVVKAIGGDLASDLDLTIAGQIVGTPSYMSPEQLRGDADVDTRADIWSLGAMLYEAVAGTRPFESSQSLAEFTSRVLERDPARPSDVAARRLDSSTLGPVPRDLDWITLRCLEKDRDRRYASASELAADLENLLADRPVTAAPPSALYRLEKAIRRHRLAALSIAGVMIAALLGLTMSARAWMETHRQAAVAAAVARFLSDDVLGAAAPSARPNEGKDVSLREVLTAAARKLDDAVARGGAFEGDHRIEGSIRRTIGETFLALGEPSAALPHLERAASLAASEFGDAHRTTLECSGRVGVALRALGRLEESAAILRSVLAGWREEDEATRRDLEKAVQDLALTETARGNRQDAIALADELEALLELDRKEFGDAAVAKGLRQNLATILARCGQHDRAEPYFIAALEASERELGEDDPSTLTARVNFAAFLRARGRGGEAGQILEDVIERQLRVLGPEHPDTLASAYNLGEILLDRGEAARAVPLLRDAAAAAEKVHGERHEHTLHLRAAHGRALEATGDLEGALAEYRSALAGARAQFGAAHVATVKFLTDEASALLALGRDEEAESALRESARSAIEVFGKEHRNSQLLRENLERFLRKRGRIEEADALMAGGAP